jgi:hypothetical protein
MPVINSNREYSTSKNIKMYLIHSTDYLYVTGDMRIASLNDSRWKKMTDSLGDLD